ncbi:DBF4-type zinc finger-containing protein 2 isoform X2 [Cyclopterus lumpus]|uniref:DBF4-type zinc finger-containing protein 2 isoform X2 n=2 Tax=Cyclopterus lumpus TaxID=8103 RepID=UPI001485C51E|nr:DBF4-type zinc finger-containing protein 2 isoform X2 [Cyclopterus lumpus]
MCFRFPVRMSDDEGDQRKVESTSRMWAESQPGPSRCQPSRQGYCGYCRVLYSNLDQHLSSLRHLDSVRVSSLGSSTVSSSSSKTKLTLLERFLQDVLQHHPHHYYDPRPSHADLPSVSTPLLPRAVLDELRFSDDDRRSLGTREHLSSSDDASCQPANQQEDNRTHIQSGEGSQERLSKPIREQEEGEIITAGNTLSSHVQAPPPYHQAPPSVHRKAHRKTNRRKTSTSSTSAPGPDPGPRPRTQPRPCLDPSPQTRTQPRPCLDLGTCPDPSPQTRTQPRPCPDPGTWSTGDHSDSLDRTIEEVIQVCRHGGSSPESLHFSLPVSTETQSDDWDSPVQRGHTLGDTPVQVSPAGRQDLSCLMEVQVDLQDQVYSYQLDSALHGEHRTGGGARQDEGFWSLPIEEVLPAPEHIPESFKRKTWTQIEQEDQRKVEKLVRQFRRGRFICYFDTESLARYGRRSQNKGRGENKEAEPAGFLPLLDRDDDDSAYVRRRRTGAFRVASRCQVVKVSHSTQTIRLVIPAVCEPASETLLTSVPPANQEAAERTPEVQIWRCLPPSYSNIVTPLQPRTSLVYLLCSPSGSTPTYTPAPGSVLKRCRKKRRPLDTQVLKVKYKQLPVKFYDPSSNRILKNPPKGFTPSSPPPPCVRQLFRSLSLDLNADRPPGAAGSSRVKGQRSSDTPFSHANGFLLTTLSRDSEKTVRRRGTTAQALPSHSRSEWGRRGRRDRTRPPPSKRRTRAQATLPLPRREGLRRAAPCSRVPGSTGRGRARKGRG